ncbi:MAG: spheroidene monooxygenase [Flavobacteriia bacterium]|nr:spheroidene monooxygenase [Flavobacteriia bacterium]
MKNVSGLSFYKMLGSGAGNGFSIWPDFSTFVLLTVWESESDFINFAETNSRHTEFHERMSNYGRAELTPFKGHGTWNGEQPFDFVNPPEGDFPLAVLTRASIKRSKAFKFWLNVPGVSKHITSTPGLIWAKGVGELPLVEQATLSIWRSAKELSSFAYGGEGKHKSMVKKTREIGWYSEEMFVRFAVNRLVGSFQQLSD